jgi:lactate dehydrogenase-like 2-hydroxyacid dehydrogenase
MRPDLVLTNAIMPSVDAELERDYIVHRVGGRADFGSLPEAVRARVRAIATRAGVGVAPELIEALPKLEIVGIYGVGTDKIDLEHARMRGVQVTNTPDVLTADVADMALGLALATLRRLCSGDRFVRGRRWANKEIMPLASKFSGKRVGILGLGRIGRAIAQRAAAFDTQIAYTGRRAHDDIPYRFEPSLLALARDSDVLIVAIAGGPDTLHLVDRPILEALGPQGVLVNVARGSVVDEHALVDALSDGRLGGAGLDVFAHEPQVPEALLGMEQVVLQPHQASATHETREAMGRLVLDNLAAHFSGRALLSAVV